jgi:polysaccharide export outer membrane protein
MARNTLAVRLLLAGLVAAVCCAGNGCFGRHDQVVMPPPPGSVPTELNKITLPPYVIESPDILLIEVYMPQPEDVTKPPPALIPQSISGQHLVKMDGTVFLGVWGSVPVSGLTLEQAADCIRQHVFKKMHSGDKQLGKAPVKSPQDMLVVVDVLAYNSKTYFICADGAGFGEQVYELAATGNETVLSAIAKINGLPDIASKRNIWVARRSPMPGMNEQILPVDYLAITRGGVAQTNYQVLPGDRIYIQAEKIFRVDRFLQKALTPIERLLGVTLLGSSTVNSLRNRNSGSGSGTP